MNYDPVNKPSHYLQHPSKVECIRITEQFNFNLGNAFKYLYRCTEKGYTLNDLRKSQWYLRRELALRDTNKNWFAWFSENENYNARFDGSAEIQAVLTFESRYSGWMNQALERIYTASVQKRGTSALVRALECVAKMIRIQEAREVGE